MYINKSPAATESVHFVTAAIEAMREAGHSAITNK